MEEIEIIQGCIKQDRKCQNALYKLYFPMMSSIAMRYTLNKDEALLNINYGFFKVLQNIKSYKSEYALATWIRNILIRHIIDELRKSKKFDFENKSLETDLLERSPSYNEGEQKLDAEYLSVLLSRLTESTRTVFVLFAVDGFKHKEIADMLNISEGTSKWHVNDARKKLTAMLKETKQIETQKTNFKITLP
jgi:RNA polymerase sigma-70 factor (ECF subfamily)